MGILKGLGNIAGDVVGGVLGGTVRVVGEITGSKFIKEIGDGVENATKFAGKTVGEISSGVWDVGAGIIKQNEKQLNEGLSDIGGAVSSTAKGVGHMVVNVVDNGTDVVKGIANSDSDLIKSGAKGLIFTAAVGVIAVGIIDVVGGPDVAQAESIEALPETNVHHVDPHYVEGYTRADDTFVEGYMRDGSDGNGYLRSNPDGIIGNNLKE